MLTVHQKISGCFRSDPGATAFARLRGYLATLRKQGQPLLAALQTVFAGRPLSPAFACTDASLPEWFTY
jgi:transposase